MTHAVATFKRFQLKFCFKSDASEFVRLISTAVPVKTPTDSAPSSSQPRALEPCPTPSPSRLLPPPFELSTPPSAMLPPASQRRRVEPPTSPTPGAGPSRSLVSAPTLAPPPIDEAAIEQMISRQLDRLLPSSTRLYDPTLSDAELEGQFDRFLAEPGFVELCDRMYDMLRTMI